MTRHIRAVSNGRAYCCPLGKRKSPLTSTTLIYLSPPLSQLVVDRPSTVCVCVCVCIYIYIYIYIYIVCVCICLSICMHVCMYMSMSVCVCLYVGVYVCIYVAVCLFVCVYMYVCMYSCMTITIYCLYVSFDIDINTLAQGIKSFLASQVWFKAIAGARTYGTNSPAITSQPR